MQIRAERGCAADTHEGVRRPELISPNLWYITLEKTNAAQKGGCKEIGDATAESKVYHPGTDRCGIKGSDR